MLPGDSKFLASDHSSVDRNKNTAYKKHVCTHQWHYQKLEARESYEKRKHRRAYVQNLRTGFPRHANPNMSDNCDEHEANKPKSLFLRGRNCSHCPDSTALSTLKQLCPQNACLSRGFP